MSSLFLYLKLRSSPLAIEHVNITDPNIHEPKGVAVATSGEVYVANGSGSGAWSLPKVAGQTGATIGQIFTSDGAGSGVWRHIPQGWGFYKDDAASQSFGTTYAKLSIDAANVLTDESWLPRVIRGAGSLWDSVADKITPINIGDTYTIRIDLPITVTSGTPDKITLGLDIGGAASPTIFIVEDNVNVTGFPSTYLLSLSYPIFCKTDFKTNGGQIFIKSNTGTIGILKPGIFIDRNTDGTF